jgi:HD-like signal output (HDOD) protein/CheY-like chemotaxis protein
MMSNQPPLRVMFVDDESRILQGLQRMLRPLREAWDMHFVQSGLIALAKMEEAPFDVVVSDMRMPGMSGAELLTEVMKSHPSTVRILLSGHSDQDLVYRTIGPTHQCLSKPCDADLLKATVQRAVTLHRMLESKAMRELAGSMSSMPSLPSLYLELVQLIQQPSTSTTDIGELVGKDIGMAAKVLQLVNSAFFGLRRTVASPVEATNLLGVETIRSLVLSVQAFSQLEVVESEHFSPTHLWKHSMATAALAKRIAASQEVTRMQVEESFMAGMLHDIGRLVLMCNLPQQYGAVMERARREGRRLEEVEQEMLGATHAEIGAYLLGLWGISDPIIEAVAYHHHPRTSTNRGFSALTAVHVANVLVHAHAHRPVDGQLEAAYLNEIGMHDRIGLWCTIAATTAGQDAP